MARHLFFVTHAEVVIDPQVPVPDWTLSDLGRRRHAAFAARCPTVTAIWCSEERKARDGAEILAQAQGLTPQLQSRLHENDRSATGYLPGPEFEATADAFFANPEVSIRGWERAIDAQARIVSAVQEIAAQARGDIAIVAHGGVGALLRAWLLKVPIDRSHDQPPGGGGHLLTIALPVDGADWHLLQDWQRIETCRVPTVTTEGA